MPERNDPCPCGSGKKYKKCCMGKAAPQRRPGGASATAVAPRKRSREDLQRMVMAANTHLDAGRLEEAIAQFEQALKIFPKLPIALAGLGRARGLRGEREEGVRLLKKAIELDGSRAPFHLALSYLLFETGEVEASLRAAERARKLDPKSVMAHQTLALTHERMNELEKAEQSAARALEIDPDHAPTKMVLASIRRRQKRLDEARALLEEIEDHYTTAAMPAWAAHEMAVVYDQLGEYDRAYDAYVRCGQAHLETPQGRRLKPDVEYRLIESYRDGITRELLRKWTATDLDDGLPVPCFLVGFPRSGTTMTEQVMAAHPDMLTLEEKGIIGEVLNGMMRTHGRDGRTIPQVLAELGRDDLLALRAEYWRIAQSHLDTRIGDRKVLDKHPLNITNVAAINVLFPEAKVIVALRDPRDCCLSCFMQDFNLNEAMINFTAMDTTTRFYAAVMGLWLRLRQMLTLDWLEFRYEDTVRDLEAEARRLLEFFGLDWDERVLSFHEVARERAIATPSYEAVTQKVYTKAIGRWKNYEAKISDAFGPLEPFITAFGYDENPT